MPTRRQGSAIDPVFVAAICFLLLVFAIGGGARHDLLSVIVLRPAAAVFFGLACFYADRSMLASARSLWLPFLALCLIVALHLVPMPPALWTALPGRDLAAQIAPALGVEQGWRPISLVPWRTLNALMSLIVPAAALLMAIRLDWLALDRLVPVVLAIGVASALLGIVQALGPSDGPFYLYDVTNQGSAVGLFANRNHHAAFLACLLPLMALYVGRSRDSESGSRASLSVRPLLAAGATLLFVVTIMLTGSRAGLLLGALALVMSLALHFDTPSSQTPAIVGKGRQKKVLLAGVGLLALLLVGVYFGGNQAAERLAEIDQAEELRFQVWQPLLAMTLDYFPVGSGIGTMVEIYQAGEPDALLSENYLNHAHNDWIEEALTGGLPMLLLLLAVLALYVRRVYGVLTSPRDRIRDRAMALAGAAIVLLLMLASIGDYPLRVPSIACFFVLAATWLYRGSESVRSSKRGQRRGWRGSTDQAKMTD